MQYYTTEKIMELVEGVSPAKLDRWVAEGFLVPPIIADGPEYTKPSSIRWSDHNLKRVKLLTKITRFERNAPDAKKNLVNNMVETYEILYCDGISDDQIRIITACGVYLVTQFDDDTGTLDRLIEFLSRPRIAHGIFEMLEKNLSPVVLISENTIKLLDKQEVDTFLNSCNQEEYVGLSFRPVLETIGLAVRSEA